MKNIIFGLTILLGVLACKPIITQKEERLGNFILRYTATADGKKEGVYERSDSATKQLVERSNYKADSLDGESIFYHPNGQMEEKRHYKNGRADGKFESFYSNGSLESEYFFVNNKMEGEYKKYYPNHQLLETVTFKGGNENGAFKEFYSNGKPKAEGTYLYNARLEGAYEIGTLTKWDSTGVMKKMNCNGAGSCTTVE